MTRYAFLLAAIIVCILVVSGWTHPTDAERALAGALGLVTAAAVASEWD